MTSGPRIPPIPAGVKPEDLVGAINDRLRRVEGLVSQGGGSTSGVGAIQLVLAVPGTLAIMSSAAPLVWFPADMQPTALIAVVKQGSSGGPVEVKITAGAAPVGAIRIPAGSTSARITGGLGKIPANALIELAITSVGLTFPGADLTVMVRF